MALPKPGRVDVAFRTACLRDDLDRLLAARGARLRLYFTGGNPRLQWSRQSGPWLTIRQTSIVHGDAWTADEHLDPETLDFRKRLVAVLEINEAEPHLVITPEGLAQFQAHFPVEGTTLGACLIECRPWNARIYQGAPQVKP